MHISSLLRTLQWLLLASQAPHDLSPGPSEPTLGKTLTLAHCAVVSSYPLNTELFPVLNPAPQDLCMAGPLSSFGSQLGTSLLRGDFANGPCTGLHPPALSPSLNFSPGHSLYTHDLSLSEITLFACLFAHAASLLHWNVNFMRAGLVQVFLLPDHTKICRRNKRMTQQFAY